MEKTGTGIQALRGTPEDAVLSVVCHQSKMCVLASIKFSIDSTLAVSWRKASNSSKQPLGTGSVMPILQARKLRLGWKIAGSESGGVGLN